MTAHAKILASEQTAAAMLDLPIEKFRELVEQHALPPPILLGGVYPRWRVSLLEAIVSGDAAKPDDEDEIEV